jgi:hypothetical protein
MCIVKTPKLPAATPEKDPAIIRNPYLDGLDPANKALRTGRSALRIERRAPGDPAPVASGPGVAAAPPPPTPARTPVAGLTQKQSLTGAIAMHMIRGTPMGDLGIARAQR